MTCIIEAGDVDTTWSI